MKMLAVFKRCLTLAAGLVIAVNHARGGSLSFTDTWKDKGSYSAYNQASYVSSTGSFTTSISLPLDGLLDTSEVDSNSVFSLSIGPVGSPVRIVSGTLGDNSTYTLGKKSAVFPVYGSDANGDQITIGSIHLSWTSTTITISGSATADLLGEESSFLSSSGGNPTNTPINGFYEVDVSFDASDNDGGTFGYTNEYVSVTGSDRETEYPSATNNQESLESGSITGTANLTPPKLTITSPSSSYQVNDANYSTLVLAGTASGHLPIQSLTVTVNGHADAVPIDTGEDTLPTNSVHWTTEAIDLSSYGGPGANAVTIYATDVAGNVAEVTRTFKWTEANRIIVQVSPANAGKVTGIKSNELLTVGLRYPVKATPANKNWIFAGWTDGSGNLITDSLSFDYLDDDLTFTNGPSPVLIANFVANPFQTGLAGTYTGLYFDTDGATLDDSGSIAITVSKTGSFSGKLVYAQNGKSYSFSGQFASSLDGTMESAYESIKISSETNLAMSIELTNSDTGLMSGYVYYPGAISEAEIQGRMSAANDGIIPGLRNLYIGIVSSDPSAGPGGYSYGSATVSTALLLIRCIWRTACRQRFRSAAALARTD